MMSDEFIQSLNKNYQFEKGYAGILYEQISKAIKSFEASLDSEHDVGIKLVSFGQTIQFHITSIGFQNPYLIAFNGTLDDGSPIKLIQHVSQISFVLIKVKRINPNEPKKPIGFLNS